jgi:hypothetical protein
MGYTRAQSPGAGNPIAQAPPQNAAYFNLATRPCVVNF